MNGASTDSNPLAFLPRMVPGGRQEWVTARRHGVSEETVREAKTLARRFDVPLQCVLVTALGVLLALLDGGAVELEIVGFGSHRFDPDPDAFARQARALAARQREGRPAPCGVSPSLVWDGCSSEPSAATAPAGCLVRVASERAGPAMRLTWQVQAGVLALQDITHLATQFATLLGALEQGDSLRGAVQACLRDQVAEEGVAEATPAPLPVLARILRQVRARPDAVAISQPDGAVSYAAAWRIAAAWAARLADEAQGCIAIDAASSAETVILLLAAWQAGLGAVPVDAGMPPERLRSLLAEFGGSAIATTRELALPPGIRPLRLATSAIGRGKPPAPVACAAFAYLVFTSGSTGRPKGVCVTHAALARSMAARDVFYRDDVRRFLLASPCYVDSAMVGLLWPLCTGGEVVIAPSGHRQDPRSLAALLIDTQPSHLLCLPTLYRVVLDALPPGAPIALSTAIIAAERAGSAVVAAHAARLPRTSLVNEYGPSEATIWASAHRCRVEQTSVPIGRAVDHVDVQVRSPRDEVCLTGQQGELRIGGPGLALGYWRRPGETAASFRPDDRPGRHGQRLYRSGDLVRCLSCGTLTYHGRIDSQVKLNGFRVEPDDIRACLEAADGVAEAFVADRGTPGCPRLVAWVVSRGEAAGGLGAKLADWLEGRLPAFMHPAATVIIPRLPRLRSGKVALEELPDPASGPTGVAPQTSTERRLAALWEEVLGVPPAGRGANFFAMGGNSLRAIQLVSCLRDDLGTEEIGIHHAMETPVFSEFAALLDTIVAAQPPSLPRIPRLAQLPGAPAPASSFQQRLYLLQRLAPEESAYNCPFVLHLTGALDVAALQRAFLQALNDHSVLQCNVAYMRGAVSLVRRLAAPAGIAGVEDATAWDAGQLDAEIAGETRRPFDLETDQLHRARLFRTGQDSWTLVVTVHHVVFDGRSIALFAESLGRCYREPAADAAAAAANLTFGDVAAWQRDRLESGAWRHQLDYWRDKLAGGTAALDLPLDQHVWQAAQSRADTLDFSLDRGTAGSVEAACREMAVTPFMFFQACFAVVLATVTRQDDVQVGTAISLRSRTDLAGIVGPMVNTAVLRTRLSGIGDFAALLDATRRCVAEMQANADIPFESVVESLSPARDRALSPLFQAFLVVQEADGLALDLGDVACRVQPYRPAFARFDLSVAITRDAGRYHGQLEFAAARLSRGTAQGILDGLLVCVGRAAANPRARLDRLAGPSRARGRAIAEWEGPVAAIAGRSLLRPIRENVTSRPDAVAVCCDGRQLTYATLWRGALRMAAALRSAGAGADTPVGVLMPRCAELPVTLLGILAAGAAYLPLEWRAPAARVERVWAAAGRPLVVVRAGMAGQVPGGAETLDVDGVLNGAGAAGCAQAAPELPQGLCYVLHTSGSSGQPKGVMVSHDAIANRLDWMQAAFGLRSGDRVMQKTPLTFDVSVWEMFWPLRAGGCVVLASAGEERDPGRLRERLARDQVSAVHFVPSLLGAFLGRPGLAGLAALDLVVCSGEPLMANHVAALRGQTGARLANLYGPTEAAVDVTHFDCSRSPGEHPVPIGRPIGNVVCRVLAAPGERAVMGAPGELHLGGVAIARGYWGQPRLTAAAFVPDAFAARPGARLYRTGDLARFRDDGQLLFLGRADAQLKVRGVRLEPAEVEAVLQAHPGVAEAAVHLHPSQRDLLVAQVVPHGPPDGLAEAVREHARRLLPQGLLPGMIVVSADLPRSSSGKLDRRKLALPEADGTPSPACLGPRTDVEAWLDRWWQEDGPGAPADFAASFFENGGHSLMGLRLSAAVEAAFGAALPLDMVFTEPSLAAVASWIENLTWLAAGTQQPSGPAVCAGSP